MCLKKLIACREKLTGYNCAAIALVYIILLVDSMLLTAIVPVLPEYLMEAYGVSETGKVENTTSVFPNKSFTSSTTPSNKKNQNESANCSLPYENKFLVEESLYVGLLFASKPLVQSLANLAVGPIVDRIGFNLPMIFGTVIMCISALLFAFGKSYPVLLVARAIQGIGSSSSSVAGIAMLADRYKTKPDEERGKAISIAFGGLAMGVLIGPSFASGVYQLAGKEAVFLVLAVVAITLTGFVLLVSGIKFHEKEEKKVNSLSSLLLDPYIVLAAMTLFLGSLGIGILEASQPLWMLQTMCPQKWELGVSFLPISASYLIMMNVGGIFFQKLPRWLVGLISLLLVAIGLFCVPFARNIFELIPPGVLHGFGIGLLDTSIFPMMAVLVDTRHKSIYGSVYAIADLSFCFAFVVGPLYAAFASKALGFRWLLWIYAIILFVYSPLVAFLRKPTTLTKEATPLLKSSENTNSDDISTSNDITADKAEEK